VDRTGRPDFWFSRGPVALFIDGCFWHGCRKCGVVPKTNTKYWTQKLDRNRARDREVNRSLRKAGVSVVRVWEHQLRNKRWLLKLNAALGGQYSAAIR
jgi:DNA mismatch endonuclease (patch repair protein)